ncbi:hypothetical protein [Spirosoma foliorum]|uniref:Uncharacterized protein n=1 Tax=Spirosoma foliorum TaxID=2710596 RepID=A0A7G5GZV9_9BACT|nr:hypothetical protein [Spirosoma foliorum]QMW04401.1 hypothetical protein H3H32_05505 [Spirosoma foliorum]
MEISYGPGQYCSSLPVSCTGSLWKGYGGWLLHTCSFLVVEATRRHSRVVRTACQAGPISVDRTIRNYQSNSVVNSCAPVFSVRPKVFKLTHAARLWPVAVSRSNGAFFPRHQLIAS